ncbi:hypothetical protein SDC9_207340 [bioreactor metagenome]|uniref:Uncharacterized protein n=1 Tax=bioreactor metagenome TaxID=1076179 RepID=A0A645JA63_9ZZZZ
MQAPLHLEFLDDPIEALCQDFNNDRTNYQNNSGVCKLI